MDFQSAVTSRKPKTGLWVLNAPICLWQRLDGYSHSGLGVEVKQGF